jgi:hypothetical protein
VLVIRVRIGTLTRRGARAGTCYCPNRYADRQYDKNQPHDDQLSMRSFLSICGRGGPS